MKKKETNLMIATVTGGAAPPVDLPEKTHQVNHQVVAAKDASGGPLFEKSGTKNFSESPAGASQES